MGLRGNGVRNMVALAPSRVRKDGRLGSRMIEQDFARILRKSRTALRTGALHPAPNLG